MSENILYIDDEASIWDNPILPGISLYELAKNIHDNHNNKKIILINTHFIFSPNNAPEKYDYLQHCAGIDLLKMLRLLGEIRHCVLYSPMSVTELLRLKPGNLIITSEGVTCVHSYSEIEKKLNNIPADEQEFQKEYPLAPAPFPKEYFKVDFQMPEDERHNWANWWGIIRLIDAHRIHFPDELKIKDESYNNIPYPPQLNRKLNQLKNLQAITLYGSSVEGFTGAAKELIKEEKLGQIDRNKIKIKENNEKLNLSVINPFPNKNPAAYIIDAKKTYKSQKTELIRKEEFDSWVLDTWNNIFIPNIVMANQLIQSLKNENRGLTLTNGTLQTEINKLQSREFLPTDLEVMRTRIINQRKNIKETNILQIDDKANDGWAEILKIILFGTTSHANFNYINKKLFNPNLDIFFENIKREINDKTDVILLDLRLFETDEGETTVEKLSGYKLLRKIKDEYPGLPVIITSASNKVWIYKTLTNAFADAYWVKEGIDMKNSTEQSLQNYYGIVKLVEKIGQEEYKFFRKISVSINNLKRIANPWWATKEWEQPAIFKNNITIEPNNGKFESLITRNLDYGILLYREWLQLFVLENNIGSIENNDKSLITKNVELHKPRLLCNIINSLSNIIEIIHRQINYRETEKECSSEVIGGTFTPYNIIASREDYVAFYLLEFRNRASHYNPTFTIDFDFFTTFFKGMLMWLTMGPYIQIDKRNIGISNLNELNKMKYGSDNTLLKKYFVKMIIDNNDLSTIYNTI